LSGIHWCAAPGLGRPENSPYWKTWVDVGWRQLMPNSAHVRGAQFGLADRSFFDSVLFARVDSILRGSPSRTRCEIPIGITLTKQLATALQLNRYIKPVVQRHVATYAVRGREDAIGYDVTQASSDIRHDAPLGVQIAVAVGATNELTIR